MHHRNVLYPIIAIIYDQHLRSLFSFPLPPLAVHLERNGKTHEKCARSVFTFHYRPKDEEIRNDDGSYVLLLLLLLSCIICCLRWPSVEMSCNYCYSYFFPFSRLPQYDSILRHRSPSSSIFSTQTQTLKVLGLRRNTTQPPRSLFISFVFSCLRANGRVSWILSFVSSSCTQHEEVRRQRRLLPENWCDKSSFWAFYKWLSFISLPLGICWVSCSVEHTNDIFEIAVILSDGRTKEQTNKQQQQWIQTEKTKLHVHIISSPSY